MPLDNLTIYQKHYDLILYAAPIINRFPRNYRFTIGEQILDCLFEIARLIARANAERDKRRRKAHLYTIDRRLQELRLLTRLAKDLQMLSIKKYGLINERAREIGRMLGGWIKATR
jgi:four helix bundle protein